MAAINQPPAKPRPLRARRVEMHPRGVLIQPRRQLMLGLLDGHPIDMIDPLAHDIIIPNVGRAGPGHTIGRGVQTNGHDEFASWNVIGKARDYRFGGR